jgi:hypothetical protein
MQELIDNALGVSPERVENWKQVSGQEIHVKQEFISPFYIGFVTGICVHM